MDLPLDSEGALDATRTDVDQVSPQDPEGRLAPRIQAKRVADLRLAAGLVDVAVQPQQRMELLDRLPHAGGAHGAAEEIPGGDRGPQVRVEKRRRVEARAVRWAVDQEDGPAWVAGLVGQPGQLLAEVVVGHLARGAPGSRVRLPRAQDL